MADLKPEDFIVSDRMVEALKSTIPRKWRVPYSPTCRACTEKRVHTPADWTRHPFQTEAAPAGGKE